MNKVKFYVCKDCGLEPIDIFVDNNFIGELPSFRYFCPPEDNDNSGVVSFLPQDDNKHTYSMKDKNGNIIAIGDFKRDSKRVVDI